MWSGVGPAVDFSKAPAEEQHRGSRPITGKGNCAIEVFQLVLPLIVVAVKP